MRMNDILQKIRIHDIVIAFTKDRAEIIKNRYGTTGEISVEDAISSLVYMFSLDTKIDWFNEAFKQEMRNVMLSVIEKHKIGGEHNESP